MKKLKCLVQHDCPRLGGTETSMANWINNMKDVLDIYVHFFDKKRELLSLFEATGVNITESCPTLVQAKYLPKDERTEFVNHLLENEPTMGGGYDFALSFFASWANNAYVTQKVNATKKFCIVHEDPDYTPRLTLMAREDLAKFNKILFVSESMKRRAHELRPEMTNFGVLRNFQNSDLIIEKSKMADEDIKFDPTKINFVSPIRIEPEQKAPIRTAAAINDLIKKDGIDNFVWTIVGDGRPHDRKALEEYIAQNGLGNNIKLAGFKPNPYPWIKAADVALLGSVYEAAPMIYGEASTLGVPIVSTRNISTDELIGDTGMVCENNQEGIRHAIGDLCRNPRKIDAMREKVKGYEYPNQQIKADFLETIAFS